MLTVVSVIILIILAMGMPALVLLTGIGYWLCGTFGAIIGAVLGVFIEASVSD